MANIKTKDTKKGTIKTIDKASIATQKIKQFYVATKEKAENVAKTDGNSPEEYASNRVENGIHKDVYDGAYLFDKAGRKGLKDTKVNYYKAKDGIHRFKQQRAEQSLRKQTSQNTNSTIKTLEKSEKKIKQSAISAGQKTIKFAGKEASKTVHKSVKTAEQVSKTAIKTSQQTAKAAQKTARATVKASQKIAQATKATAKATATTIKAAAKATVTAVRAIIAGTKTLVAAIAAGGWVSVVVIILICLVAALCSSFYGIFFSSETSQSGMNITSVIQQINNEFDDKIDEIKSSGSFDGVEVIGSRSNWKDVLSIYAVKTTTDENNPMEIATVDETKKSILSSIFWDMNNISKSVETRTETITKESTDEQGNTVETTEQVEKKYLVITLTGKSAEDMSTSYSFNATQKKYLAELMSDKNNKLWASLIYNIGGVSGGGSIDIKDLDFSNETVNDTQKKIVAVATNSAKYGISARSGYCQAWVADVYQAVTGSRGSAHCALCAADMWAVSSDFSQIPVGATVYGYSSSQYGHVGIYIGNGMVVHNIGEIKIQSLESWIKTYKGFAWGWENGKNLIYNTMKKSE